MNKTIESLKLSIDNSKRIKEKLLSNLESQNKKTILLNLVELDFDFDNQEVEIIYYVVDNKYPNTKVDFSRLKEILETSNGY